MMLHRHYPGHPAWLVYVMVLAFVVNALIAGMGVIESRWDWVVTNGVVALLVLFSLFVGYQPSR